MSVGKVVPMSGGKIVKHATRPPSYMSLEGTIPFANKRKGRDSADSIISLDTRELMPSNSKSSQGLVDRVGNTK